MRNDHPGLICARTLYRVCLTKYLASSTCGKSEPDGQNKQTKGPFIVPIKTLRRVHAIRTTLIIIEWFPTRQIYRLHPQVRIVPSVRSIAYYSGRLSVEFPPPTRKERMEARAYHKRCTEYIELACTGYHLHLYRSIWLDSAAGPSD